MRVWTKLTAATLGLGLILACAGGDDPPPELASPAPEIVAAHTAGSIRSSDDIVVQLTADVPDAQPGAEVDLIRLFPSVPGKATWTSPREITFVPDQPLASGVDYTVQVALSTLDPAWTDFGFQVSVVPLSARIVSMGLEAQAEDGAVQRFRGSVVANDFLADADAEAMLSATFGTEAVAVTWTHNSPLDHGFTIEGLRRADQPKRLTLSLDTKRLGDTEAVEHTVDLPGTGTFVVTDIQVQAGIERYVDVQFSDPVDPKQKLDGLITVDGHDGLSFDVQGSTVRIDSSSGWQSPFTVNIRDVKNTRGVVMAEPVSLTRSFDPQKPAARFVGSGVVLPRSQSLTVPIEVANLRSVVVTAYQVFDDNMGQFLQVNPLDGDRELSRVGRVVWKQRVDVGSPATGDWSRVGLDLSPLVAAHPGGMYRLELDFTRSDVVWTCPTPAPPAAPVSIDHDGWQQGDAESSYWDSYEDSDGIPGWQLYEQREDPCSPGYYREYYDHKIRSGRNVLLSNLGLTAKMGEDRRLLAFATDLDTAMPRPGVAVQVLDYQQQVIAESTRTPRGSSSTAGQRTRCRTSTSAAPASPRASRVRSMPSGACGAPATTSS